MYHAQQPCARAPVPLPCKSSISWHNCQDPDTTRVAAQRVLNSLGRFPAVALLGPRQVGKTTLAHALTDHLSNSIVYVDLELPSDRAKLTDPELYLSSHEGRLLILDEVHRSPDLFQTLRGIIDSRRRRGMRNNQFLLLGSASIDLLKQSAESLAGRIGYVELTPFLLTEVQQTAPGGDDQLWVRGGFPDSYLALDDAASFHWRTAFIQTYLERDLPSLGPRIPAETLHRFWRMLAHNQAQLLNAASLASSLAVSGQTVARYLDVLVDLLLVRRLEPRTENTGKRIVRSPKVFVRDSGLPHALLGITDREDLLGHPVAGASWEGFVIENIIAAVSAGKSVSFYRTSAGAEIDLILDLGTKEVWAIEIKRSLATPHPSKGFHIACDDVRATRRFVIYPGKERYLLDPKTEVISLLQLVQSELSA